MIWDVAPRFGAENAADSVWWVCGDAAMADWIDRSHCCHCGEANVLEKRDELLSMKRVADTLTMRRLGGERALGVGGAARE